MQYHQYSKLFTSGLLSDPSPPRVPGPRPRKGRTLFLNPTDPGSLQPTDSRTYSFLELADSIASPVSPADPPSPRRSLGHPTTSATANPTPIGKPGPTRMRGIVLRSTALGPASPLDSLPKLSIVPTDQSFLVTDSSLPDSPILDRRPSHKTAISTSASSASLSVNSETKRKNRLVALACLEGRETSSRMAPRKTQLNFMSMSDDEDEDDSLVPSPHPSTDRVARRSSTFTASHASVLAKVDLPADPLASRSSQRSKIAPASDRPRSQTTESWFSNLVDLRNEEDSSNWRSFIELSTPTA